jgi:S-DNA-T family DNA segregation ATPase FtsK/SpoIIIE
MTSSGPDFMKVYPPDVRNSFKTKIAFKTSDGKSSRLIIGKSGAEKLDGKGQMLFKTSSSDRLRKLQGFYVDTVEEAKRDGRLKEILVMANKIAKEREQSLEDERKYGDYLFNEAIMIVREAGKASASLLQRRLKVGYERAATLLDLLEKHGHIGPGKGASPREVYPNPKIS